MRFLTPRNFHLYLFICCCFALTDVSGSTRDSISLNGTTFRFEIPENWKTGEASGAGVSPSPFLYPNLSDWRTMHYLFADTNQYLNMTVGFHRANSNEIWFPTNDAVRDSLFQGKKFKKKNIPVINGEDPHVLTLEVEFFPVWSASRFYKITVQDKQTFYAICFYTCRLNNTQELMVLTEGKLNPNDTGFARKSAGEFLDSLLKNNSAQVTKLNPYHVLLNKPIDSCQVKNIWLRFPHIEGWNYVKPAALDSGRITYLVYQPADYDHCLPVEIQVSSYDLDFTGDAMKRKELVGQYRREVEKLPSREKHAIYTKLDSMHRQHDTTATAIQHWYPGSSFYPEEFSYCGSNVNASTHVIFLQCWTSEYKKTKIIIKLTCCGDDPGKFQLIDQMFIDFVMYIIGNNDFEKMYQGK